MLAAPLAGFLVHFLVKSFLMEKTTGSYLSEMVVQFLFTGPIEEGSKFMAVFLVAHKKRDFKNSYDGILLAVFASLGFAGVENLLYLYAFGVENTLPRLILGNLGHACFSVLWGYALAVTLHENAPFSILILALLSSAILHGGYNYFLGFHLWGAAVALFILFCLLIFFYTLMIVEKNRNRDQNLKTDEIKKKSRM